MKFFFRRLILCMALLIMLLIVPYGANAANDLDWKPVCKEKLNAVAYGKGTYVAVGADGVIVTSKDGTVWKKVKCRAAAALNGVFWSGEKFIAVGDNGIILCSKDALSWKKLSSGTRASLRKAASKNGQCVIVGDRGTILYSKNCEKWSSAKSGIKDSLRGIAANDKLFVAVGDDSVIITSADGISWKVSGGWQGSSGSNFMLQGIDWSNNTFCIAGYSKGKTYPLYMLSSTAQSWYVETIEALGMDDMKGIRLLGVTWDGTQNIAIGTRGSVLALPDCYKCRRYKAISDKDLLGIVRCGDKAIAVGTGGIFVSEIDTRIQSITPGVASSHIASGSYLIDVRNIDEYSEKHIPKSINIPLDQLEKKIGTVVPDKEKEIIVYCAKGVRSHKAAEVLLKLGYRYVFNMGGIDKWPYETESGTMLKK